MRKKKYDVAQLWFCYGCSSVFSTNLVSGKHYPLRVIIDALRWYHQGFTVKETLTHIKRRYGYAPHENAVWKWLGEYRDLCSFARLRKTTKKIFSPHRIVRSVKLYHRQVYEYSIHRGKLAALLDPQAEHRRFRRIGEYLEHMVTDCPHELFSEDAATARASSAKGTGKFDLSQVQIINKQNLATDTAKFVLSAVTNNRLRHESLQRFMLLCDSVTIATEVPIVLDQADFAALIAAGFEIPTELARPTTGHIDFLQIRNGSIHILDYKPDARTNHPIEQLTLYALALSRATGIRLYDFKCAWFNEDTYCEFFPLHVVHKIDPRAA